MQISRIVIVSLIVMVAVLATPPQMHAAGRRNGDDLKWTSPNVDSVQSAEPIPSTPAPSYVAPDPYSPGYFSPQPPAQNWVNGQGGNLPGGPYGRVGNPYYYTPQSYDPAGGFSGSDPYTLHFGQGYYRSYEYGHHRFPYYSYRRPWYFPGHTSYNRDTNYPW
ncbi:MAG: hypothetical protein KDA68_19775 [Planctomycetaceae bacterium]|nr:hypothetical protein [Planctomycetaceae bacterium]